MLLSADLPYLSSGQSNILGKIFQNKLIIQKLITE